jgi:uncharacterized phage infection (PIP) family protein YhgE
LLSGNEQLLAARQSADRDWQATQQNQLDQLIARITQQLQTLRDEEAQRSAAAQQRFADLEQQVGEHLQQLGSALQEPLTRVIDSALEAPRAAAELMNQLQARGAELAERDNHTLAERAELMQQLEGLLGALTQSAAAQQQTIASLVEATSSTLTTINEQFASAVQGETEKLTSIAADLTASLVEAASFGTSFDAGVKTFSDANTQLAQTLQQITTALNEATTRSDEQLAYYVAQAREVIDLSLMSQKAVLVKSESFLTYNQK